jgi:hypothetical protein
MKLSKQDAFILSNALIILSSEGKYVDGAGELALRLSDYLIYGVDSQTEAEEKDKLDQDDINDGFKGQPEQEKSEYLAPEKFDKFLGDRDKQDPLKCKVVSSSCGMPDDRCYLTISSEVIDVYNEDDDKFTSIGSPIMIKRTANTVQIKTGIGWHSFYLTKFPKFWTKMLELDQTYRIGW